MLKFYNAYEDRDLLVTSRRVFDGVDGPTETFEPGEEGSIELDGDHQVVFATRARAGNEAPLAELPSAKKVTYSDDEGGSGSDVLDFGGDDSVRGPDNPSVSGGEGNDILGSGDGADSVPGNAAPSVTGGEGNDTLPTSGTIQQLREPSDDVVRAEIKAMVDAKEDLTRTGLPELPALNKRLAAQGFGPVDAERRSSLMPAPAQ